MPILPFSSNGATPAEPSRPARDLLDGFSVEVLPRTVAKIPDLRRLFPAGTRIYVAHVEGTPLDDMVATARRLTAEGFQAMPHIPARLIADRAAFETWLKRYREEAGVTQALVIAGGRKRPVGAYESAIQLLESGLFDQLGFTRLHVAGHPEGNRDIDPDGGTRLVDEAALWKQAFSERTDAEMALVTQFAFDAAPVVDWATRIAAAGVTLPIHVGVAGPAKLSTLLKFAIACGVGPSLGVLQKRARDLSKLLLPYEPTAFIDALAEKAARAPGCAIAQLHFFPLGGVERTAEYLMRRRSTLSAAAR